MTLEDRLVDSSDMSACYVKHGIPQKEPSWVDKTHAVLGRMVDIIANTNVYSPPQDLVAYDIFLRLSWKLKSVCQPSKRIWLKRRVKNRIEHLKKCHGPRFDICFEKTKPYGCFISSRHIQK